MMCYTSQSTGTAKDVPAAGESVGLVLNVRCAEAGVPGEMRCADRERVTLKESG
jgi:hypothetical protein